MTLTETLVDYPRGAVGGTGTVVALIPHDASTAVITDRTSFHPLDHTWPDQGADSGVLMVDGGQVPVTDVVLAATDGETVALGEEIPVRRGADGWTFLVAHLIAGDGPVPEVGADVGFAVDPDHRRALSAGHTACHLAALALNAAVADLWRKPVPVDGLGRPDFDHAAIAGCPEIVGYGSIDRYRLGKSLRKKGFDSAALLERLDTVTATANAQLADWVAAAAPVRLEIAGPGLTDLRTWVCELPDGSARIPCGGTHLASLGELASVTVALAGAAESLTMTTTAVPA